MRLRSILLACLAVLGAASCAPEQRSPEPGDALAFVRCGQVEAPPSTGQGPRNKFCAQVTVRDSMGFERILQLLLVSDQERDPLADRRVLVYHPGGPGVSAVELTGQDPPAVDLATFVVLAWDGTTASTTPGTCGPASMAFGMNRSVEHLAADAKAIGEECLGGFGGLEDIGAAAAAEELESIRVAVGVETFDLLAISYGTAIAEHYLRMHGGSVRRAVLDAPLALEAGWPQRLEAVGRALADGADALARSCATERCSALAVPGGTLGYAAVRRAVLAAAPTVGGGQATFSATIFDQAAQLALRSDASWPAWSDAVDAALGGDGTALWAIGEKEYFDLDRAVFYRSLCADIDRPADPAAYGSPADDLLRAWTTALAPCTAFPHRDLPAMSTGRDADVLILASDHDVLAPASLLDAAPDLRSLGRVCHTGVVGHTSSRDPSFRTVVSGFLTGGTDQGLCVTP